MRRGFPGTGQRTRRIPRLAHRATARTVELPLPGGPRCGAVNERRKIAARNKEGIMGNRRWNISPGVPGHRPGEMSGGEADVSLHNGTG